MAVDLGAIRAGLVANLANVPRIRAFSEVPANAPTGSYDLVTVEPGSPYIEYEVGAAYTTRCVVNLVVRVITQTSTWEDAQERVDELLSTGTSDSRSLRDAIEGTVNLGGAACDVTVLQARFVETANGPDSAFGAEMDVRVLARSAT